MHMCTHNITLVLSEIHIHILTEYILVIKIK